MWRKKNATRSAVMLAAAGIATFGLQHIPTSQKDACNRGQPSNDAAEYTDEVVAVLIAGVSSAMASQRLR